jgi:dihydroneopterin aldolase
MRFHVRVGILPHERELPQPLEIDLTVNRATDATGVSDYRALYALVRAVVAAEPLEYLETAAGAIVASALRLDGVQSARVAVRKPHVALDGPLAFAEIVVEGRNG